jgi:hypothetical protein
MCISHVSLRQANVKHSKPYTRQELLGRPPFPPDRGELCPHCDMRIPEFADLSESEMARVCEHLREDRTLMAIQELRSATNAPLAFAHLWVAHRGRPLPPEGSDPAPCPLCGKPLRTPLSKQCRHCKRDWHSPDEVADLSQIRRDRSKSR